MRYALCVMRYALCVMRYAKLFFSNLQNSFLTTNSKIVICWKVECQFGVKSVKNYLLFAFYMRMI